MFGGSSVVSDGWQTITAAQEATSVVSWLEAKGLGKYVEKIIEASDAEHVEDLKLLNATMVEEIIKTVDLKHVSAQKFRNAVAELRDANAHVTAPAKATPQEG